MGHKFKIGQSVVPTYSGIEQRDVYEIVRLMPELPNGERQYRVKAISSGTERIVREVEIRPA
jgi:hypothetical protein